MDTASTGSGESRQVRPRHVIQTITNSTISLTETASIRNTHEESKFNYVVNRSKNILKKYGSFMGPGMLISVAYMDPGNYATGITAGASNKYSLLFIVFLSNVIAIFLQSLCIKLGSVTGYDLARSCREFYLSN